MQFLKEMYIGEGIEHRRIVEWKLKHGAGMKDIYIISVSRGKNQLDCMHCAYFKQKNIRKYTGLVVGMAKGYGEAQKLMISMIEDAYKDTETANVKEYLLKKYKE